MGEHLDTILNWVLTAISIICVTIVTYINNKVDRSIEKILEAEKRSNNYTDRKADNFTELMQRQDERFLRSLEEVVSSVRVNAKLSVSKPACESAQKLFKQELDTNRRLDELEHKALTTAISGISESIEIQFKMMEEIKECLHHIQMEKPC